uniref:B30.2/SPRY domain-containing protein n=1 Tax=Oncorhynchus tshawytscha TaxID=74940 RepID=A0A8C8JXN4_ONCTS
MATPASVLELLLDTLDSLVSSELKRFQYLLTKNMLDGWFPIPKSRLENADREDTVEKMVSAYSHEGAVKISLTILRKMGQNDLAMKLERGTLEEVILKQISSLEQDLQKDDRYKYIQNSTLPGTQQVSGVLIDMAKHLGNLQFRVWEKMKEIVQFTPVILNPNTANRWLSVSDNLTSVRFNNIGQQITDNPERFAQYAKVLGSEGFSSGKHIWEVEVGDHPEWNLGVAKETIDRKGEILASPAYGIWAILNRNGVYQSGKGEPLAFEKLKRIRVQLDFTSGEVSFYDPKDMTHIYTHKDTFAERLYPYFLVGLAGGANNPDIHICQSEVSLTVMASQ